MGIVTNQFDFIDARFRSHRIKVLDVVCCEAGQAVEIVTADAAVADELRDPTTGDVILGRVLRASITDATASIVNNKVNNRFIVTVQVFDVSSGVPGQLTEQLRPVSGGRLTVCRYQELEMSSKA